ncbi:MAG: hypothetical protein PHN31_00700 [Candidatus Gracilibacteria bacterium]|nr:hypothetical protein [Candidatus Gracilibacteria bacterium]
MSNKNILYTKGPEQGKNVIGDTEREIVKSRVSELIESSENTLVTEIIRQDVFIEEFISYVKDIGFFQGKEDYINSALLKEILKKVFKDKDLNQKEKEILYKFLDNYSEIFYISKDAYAEEFNYELTRKLKEKTEVFGKIEKIENKTLLFDEMLKKMEKAKADFSPKETIIKDKNIINISDIEKQTIETEDKINTKKDELRQKHNECKIYLGKEKYAQVISNQIDFTKISQINTKIKIIKNKLNETNSKITKAQLFEKMNILLDEKLKIYLRIEKSIREILKDRNLIIKNLFKKHTFIKDKIENLKNKANYLKDESIDNSIIFIDEKLNELEILLNHELSSKNDFVYTEKELNKTYKKFEELTIKIEEYLENDFSKERINKFKGLYDNNNELISKNSNNIEKIYQNYISKKEDLKKYRGNRVIYKVENIYSENLKLEKIIQSLEKLKELSKSKIDTKTYITGLKRGIELQNNIINRQNHILTILENYKGFGDELLSENEIKIKDLMERYTKLKENLISFKEQVRNENNSIFMSKLSWIIKKFNSLQTTDFFKKDINYIETFMNRIDEEVLELKNEINLSKTIIQNSNNNKDDYLDNIKINEGKEKKQKKKTFGGWIKNKFKSFFT